MKKLLVIIMLAFAAPVFANDMYVIPHVNLAFGFGDAYEPATDFSANPGIGFGGVFGYRINSTLIAEGSISYLYWMTDHPAGADYSMYQLPIFGGVNYAIDKQIGIIGGVGVAYASSTVEIGGVETDTSDTELAFYFGAHIDFDKIIVRPQFVYINTAEDAQTYLQVSAGYKFDLE